MSSIYLCVQAMIKGNTMPVYLIVKVKLAVIDKIYQRRRIF